MLTPVGLETPLRAELKELDHVNAVAAVVHIEHEGANETHS